MVDLSKEMSRPLIREAGIASTEDWSGAETKLYLPVGWADNEEATCTIQFCDSRQCLNITDESGQVVDIIYPKDVVGVHVEVMLLGGLLTPPRFATSPRAATDETSSAKCNVFQSLANDESNDGVFIKCNTNAPCGDLPLDSQGTAILHLYVYERARTNVNWLCGTAKPKAPNPNFEPNRDGVRYANHRSFQVCPQEDLSPLTKLIKSIRRVAKLSPLPRKYLVIVNPQAGTHQAKRIFEETVRPILENEAGIELVVKETEHAAHGTEIAKEESLGNYDAIVCLGGDGIIHEVFQGIQSRDDKEEIYKKITLGVIGCGTGNGLAKSLTHEANEHYSHLESTFLIARGETIKMDLSKYQTKNKHYTGFLTFTWAMIADIDIESEYLRWLGSMRIDLWGVYCIAWLRSYRAKLSYLPKGNPIEMPDSLEDPVPSNWEVIEDDIVLLWASQVSHAATSAYSSPPSSMTDGVFQILLVRNSSNVSRLQMASILLSLDHGTHVNNPHVEFIECIAYRLEPATSQDSFNDLDGEVIEEGPIQGHVVPGALQVFGTTNI